MACGTCGNSRHEKEFECRLFLDLWPHGTRNKGNFMSIVCDCKLFSTYALNLKFRIHDQSISISCISQFQQCPFPPGNSGAFSHTFHPGGRELTFHPITPGHLTTPHSFTKYNIVVSFYDHFIGNTVSFFLNTST